MKIPNNFNDIISNAAIEYAEKGWSCFPLSLGDKRPLASWRQYQTSIASEDEIASWSENGAPRTDADTKAVVGHEKYFNLALVTGAISGFVVVDCDNEAAVQYAQKNNLVSPIAVQTSRGMHYYWRHPQNGRRYRNKAGSKPGASWHNFPGLDFRGDGGYVVAPPSVSLHPTGEIKHEYAWRIAPGLSFDDMPVWRGPADDMDFNEDFDFATMSLEGVGIGEVSVDVREQVMQRVAHLGRKLQGPDCGDNTDDWMIRYCGQAVRRGLVGKDLMRDVTAFYNEFFEWRGRSKTEWERWIKTKVRSAIDMDRRNHPTDYDPQTKERLSPKKQEEKKQQQEVETQERGERIISIKSITDADYQRILDSLGDVAYHVDPIIPSRSITQVVGYNGHGKSMFIASLTNALAAGNKQFGAFFMEGKARVLYLDYDNPPRTALGRMKKFTEVYGATGENFHLWYPSIPKEHGGGEMNLRTKEGLMLFEMWMNAIKPDIVVIDTVRNAFGGLDEKTPQDWHQVNRVAKIIRDGFKASVVLVHHRNKPNEQGLGREAGSTAQLTDIDTQVIVTQVYKEKNVAKQKAGLFDEDIMFERGSNPYSPFVYFNEKLSRANMASTHRVRMVSEISFGKVREQTDMHRTSYLGWVESIVTGEQGLLWTPGPREDAIEMFKKGIAPADIAQKLFIPTIEIEKWIKKI